MEPRPHERGNRSDSLRRRCRRPALQWGHVLTNGETRGGLRQPVGRQAGFNGATSSRTWKPTGRRRHLVWFPELQWSHVLTNVETDGFAGVAVEEEKASMDTRPHERGNLRVNLD